MTTRPEGAVRAFSTDEDRWAAVSGRDRSADGHFVYSVRTTGVFCRPWCPSRLPLRENVAFHAGSAEARASGFRPCLRCRPESGRPGRGAVATVARAARAMEALGPATSVGELAAAAGMSPSHFRRTFKAVVGVSPKHYAAAVSTKRIRSALDAEPSVSAAVFAAGYEAPSRFYADAADRLGMTPGVYRRGGPGETIRMAVAESSLGAVLVAATDRGVCAVELASDPDALVRRLLDRHPAARFAEADAGFETVVRTVVGLVEDPGPAADLPLDVRGTAFQESVWRALRDIPTGETRSYTDIARSLGRPTAARAVAGACAANRVAVLVPCHRVVRTDGSLSGYRWGVERKAELLRREREREE